MSETKYKYDIFFKIEEIGKPGKNGKRPFTLIDNEGYNCGIFATYRHAKEAIPRIRRNLIKELKRREALKEGK